MPLEVLSNRSGKSVRFHRSKVRNVLLAATLLSGCAESTPENRMVFQVGIQPHPHEGVAHYLAFAIGKSTIRTIPVTVSLMSGQGELYSQTVSQPLSNSVVMDRLCCPPNTLITPANIVRLVDSGTCNTSSDRGQCSRDLLDSDTRVASLTSLQGPTRSSVVHLGFTYPLPPTMQPTGIFYVGSSVRVAPIYGSGSNR